MHQVITFYHRWDEDCIISFTAYILTWRLRCILIADALQN